jgi:spermidine/putrescine-binding protein
MKTLRTHALAITTASLAAVGCASNILLTQNSESIDVGMAGSYYAAALSDCAKASATKSTNARTLAASWCRWGYTAWMSASGVENCGST